MRFFLAVVFIYLSQRPSHSTFFVLCFHTVKPLRSNPFFMETMRYFEYSFIVFNKNNPIDVYSRPTANHNSLNCHIKTSSITIYAPY